MQLQTLDRDVVRQRQAEIARMFRLIRDSDLFSFVVEDFFINIRSLCVLCSVF
jgi:hypothetical protein